MALISDDIGLAIDFLNKQEVIAIPTETVYGLAGNALNESAIKSIFEIKNRPLYNPLIVHIASIYQLDTIAKDIPEKARILAQTFWPGPLTLVLKKQSHLSSLLTANKNTVAVRVPNHAVTLNLLKNLAYPLAAPSANSFGYISPTSSQHVQDDLGDKIPFILEGGNCTIGIESTIIGFDGDRPILYRQGYISKEEIENIVGPISSNTSHSATSPEAPGMLLKHYSPITKTYLSTDIKESIQKFEGKKMGLLLFKGGNYPANLHQEILSPKGDLKQAARNLYAALHRLDHEQLDVIIAEYCPNVGIGISINDKLVRASSN